MGRTAPVPATTVNVDFINPFLAAVSTVLQTMSSINPTPRRPLLKSDELPPGDVTGIIGMTSLGCNGSMAFVLPQSCALEIVSKMMGQTYSELEADVIDGIGELTNQICGQAKKGLGERGYRFQLSIPNVIRGKEHVVEHMTGAPIIVVPFQVESGVFYIEASFEHRSL